MLSEVYGEMTPKRSSETDVLKNLELTRRLESEESTRIWNERLVVTDAPHLYPSL